MYAERDGLTLEVRSIFRVIEHWKIRRSRFLIGKSRSVVENPEIKLFLQV